MSGSGGCQMKNNGIKGFGNGFWLLVCLLQCWGSNPGPHTGQASALPLSDTPRPLDLI
jgi:hypothetical protein